MEVSLTGLNQKKCVKVRNKGNRKTVPNSQHPQAHRLLVFPRFALPSPHDDLGFTFVNKLLLCVTFCSYSRLAFQPLIVDVCP